MQKSNCYVSYVCLIHFPNVEDRSLRMYSDQCIYAMFVSASLYCIIVLMPSPNPVCPWHIYTHTSTWKHRHRHTFTQTHTNTDMHMIGHRHVAMIPKPLLITTLSLTLTSETRRVDMSPTQCNWFNVSKKRYPIGQTGKTWRRVMVLWKAILIWLAARPQHYHSIILYNSP